MTGTYAGLRVVGSYGFATNTAVIGDGSALLIAETPGAPVEMRAVEPSIGGMEVGSSARSKRRCSTRPGSSTSPKGGPPVTAVKVIRRFRELRDVEFGTPANGDAVVYDADTDELILSSSGTVGPQGPEGVQGPAGPTGPQGAAGTGITAKGEVATSSLLPASGNTQGDAYIVQSDDSLWIWDGTHWVSGGSIQGPPGAQGIQGVQGPTGAQGPSGAAGAAGAQGPSGQAAGKIFYPAPSDSSDISTYKTLLPSPSAAAEQTIATPCTAASGDTLVAVFATDPGVPGAVDYPAGTGSRLIYAMVSAGTARFHLQVYKRTVAGVRDADP